MTKPRIAINGAGFSGLTLAWALRREGFEVEIFEASARCGGLIETQKKIIPVESAANAILASKNVETLLGDLKIKPLQAGYRSKKRYIYKEGFQRFPISFFSLIHGLVRLGYAALKKQLKPQSTETVSDWGLRCLNQSFADSLLSPGLQGVYGVPADQLSAELVLGSMSEKSLRPIKGALRGSLAPELGMQQLIDALSSSLKKQGVQIHLEEKADLDRIGFSAQVLATSMDQAGEILSQKAPMASQYLVGSPMAPLTSVTLGFEKPKPIKGFGCLFTSSAKLNSLGVLFNSDIFPNRGSLESETWILNKKHPSLNDVLVDRARILNSTDNPQFTSIKNYPKALPIYSSKLKSFLESDVFMRLDKPQVFEVLKNGARLKESAAQPLYLTGNYLGAIGLSKILDYNIRLVERMKKDLL